MSAYFILMQNIEDPARYGGEYIPQVMPFLQKHGAEIVAATHEAEALEGDAPNGVVVLRFPNEEAVKAFVNDPDYQPAKKLRHSITTRGQAVLAPEFVMPE